MCIITLSMQSCQSEETYAEQRDRELSCISAFIAANKISVISEEKFKAQGYTTGTDEYVLFENNGVYMNIVNKGTDGEPLAKGKGEDILIRYQEVNINADPDTIMSQNMNLLYTNLPDKINVRNVSGSYIAKEEYGVLMNTYHSQQVPSGWLVPLKYINLGRGDSKADKDGNVGSIAKVRLIVPHDQGTTAATAGVYACYYFLSYELDK